MGNSGAVERGLQEDREKEEVTWKKRRGRYPGWLRGKDSLGLGSQVNALKTADQVSTSPAKEELGFILQTREPTHELLSPT